MKTASSKNTSPNILFIFIAFGSGIFLQAKYNIQQNLLQCPSSKKDMKRQKLKEIFHVSQILSRSEVRVQEVKDHPTHQEQLIQCIDHKNNQSINAYLLIPKSTTSSSKFPADLCIHGHHSTKKNVAGITPSKYNINFGHTLVKKGYITLLYRILDTRRISGDLKIPQD